MMEKVNATIDMIKKDFFDWIIERRDEAGWNDAELSTAAGISQSNLSLIMSGQRNITFDFCKALAQAFRVRPEEVLYRAGLLSPSLGRLDELTENEGELIRLYRALSPEHQDVILETCRGLFERARRKRK